MRRHLLAGLAALPFAHRRKRHERAAGERDGAAPDLMVGRGILLPLTDWDIFEVSRAIWGEARGVSLGGQIAVVHTLCNRVMSGHRAFIGATTLALAVLQPGQFCPDTAPSAERGWLNRVVRQAVSMHRDGFDVTGGAEFFARSDCDPPWRWSVREVARFDDQVFYRMRFA